MTHVFSMACPPHLVHPPLPLMPRSPLASTSMIWCTTLPMTLLKNASKRFWRLNSRYPLWALSTGSLVLILHGWILMMGISLYISCRLLLPRMWSNAIANNTLTSTHVLHHIDQAFPLIVYLYSGDPDEPTFLRLRAQYQSLVGSLNSQLARHQYQTRSCTNYILPCSVQESQSYTATDGCSHLCGQVSL